LILVVLMEAKKLMRKLTVLASLLLLLPAVSQAKSLEDLLVEKGVITKSEARGAHHEGGAKVYWRNGSRLDFADTGFSTSIYTKFQTRYTFTDVDNDVAPGASNVSGFSVQTARLGVAGSVLHEEFEYNVEFELGRGEPGLNNGGATLLDAYMTWNACDWGGVQMGQFRPDISRGFSTRVENLQFADRSVVSDFYSIQRNQGVRADVALNDDWQFAAALFNGNSTNEGLNGNGTDNNHLMVVSLRGNLMGDMDPFVEGDIGNTEDMAVNVGVAAGFGENELAFVGATVDEFVLSADLNVKQGGMSFHAEYFTLEHDLGGGADLSSDGFYAQLGYFLEPKEWELALRYGYIDCDNGAAIGNDIQGGLGNSVNVCNDGTAVADDVNEVNLGLNYYWWKNHMKAQLGYSMLDKDLAAPINGEDDEIETRWILQLSSYF